MNIMSPTDHADFTQLLLLRTYHWLAFPWYTNRTRKLHKYRGLVMRKSNLLGVIFAVAAMLPLAAAQASVVAKVDVSSQTMNVYVDGQLTYSWPVSTARAGYYTPRGSYGVQSLQAMHYSQKYHNSPMPHSVFFKGGFAVHGTGAVGQLGRPASHGCVRLSPGNAAELYSLIQEHGRGGSRIVVQN